MLKVCNDLLMYFLCPVLWISINCFAKKCAIYNWALHGSRWSIHPKSFYLDLSWVSLSHRRSIFLCSKSFLIASRCFRVSASLRAFEFAGRWLLRTTEICVIISTRANQQLMPEMAWGQILLRTFPIGHQVLFKIATLPWTYL